MTGMESQTAALTERQRQLLRYVIGYIEAAGYPPSLREIGEHMGIRSTNGVMDHLKALEAKGYIEREPLKSRSLRVLRRPNGQTIDSLEDRIFQALRPLHRQDGFRPALERALVRLRSTPKDEKVEQC